MTGRRKMLCPDCGWVCPAPYCADCGVRAVPAVRPDASDFALEPVIRHGQRCVVCGSSLLAGWRHVPTGETWCGRCSQVAVWVEPGSVA